MGRDDAFPIGCYGKLPFWPEYIEHLATTPAASAFKRWIEAGRAEASLEQAGEVRERARLRFLMTNPSSPESLVGVMRPSQDAARRSHPFAVFIRLPRRDHAGRFAALALGLAPIWEALDDAWEALAGSPSPGVFSDLRRSFAIPPPRPLPELVAELKAGLGDRAGSILAGGGQGRVATTLAALAAGARDPAERVRPPVLVPVSEDARRACRDLAFWIDLVDRQFMWRRPEPTIFATAAVDGLITSASLLFGPLCPHDYRLVLESPDRRGEAGQDAVESDRSVPTYAELLAMRTRR